MSYSEWADFVYYDVGNIASYNGIVYQALLANRNVVPTTLAPNWQLLPAPAGAGVSSLETLTGAITLSSPTATFTTAGNDIAMTIAYPVAPVDSVNGLLGALTINADANTTLAINTNAPNTITASLVVGSRGIYTEDTGGATTTTITAACQTGWVIIATYIHTGGGGGSQYIKSLVAGNGSFTITCNTNIDVGDTIAWFVVGSNNAPI